MSNLEERQNKLQIVESPEETEIKEEEPGTSGMSGDRPQKRAGRRPGRRSSKMDVRAKLERSRQSARECRARKKLRYQYLEDLVANREKAVFALRDELEMYKQWCLQIDSGLMPVALLQIADSESESTDVVESKRQRLDITIEEDKNFSDVEAQDGPAKMNEQSTYKQKISDSFMGSNSSFNGTRKGGFQFKHDDDSDCEDVDGSRTGDIMWTLEGDIIRIEPRTKHSVLRGSNFLLPTIAEESEN